MQHHLFPDDGGLSLRNECAVGTGRKGGEGLDEGGVGRTELLLSEGVVGVAVGVELVAASAKVGRGQCRGDVAQERTGEVDDLRKGEAELAGWGLVGVGCPGGGFETGDVVRVGRGNDGGVSWGVDFLRIMSAASNAIAIPHTHQEDIDAVLHEMSSGSNGKRKRRTEAAY